MTTSGALSDTGFALDLQSIPLAEHADKVIMTVAEFTRVQLTIKATPPNTARAGFALPADHVHRSTNLDPDFAANAPLVLMRNAQPDIALIVTCAPANLPIRWTVVRNPADHASLGGAGALPTVTEIPAAPTTATLSADVRAALAAEQILAASHADAGARVKALLKVLDNAYGERARVQGLFGRYLWARIEPEYATAEHQLYPRLSKIFAARDSTAELRQSLIEGVVTAVTEDGDGNPHALKLARAVLALLTQPEAAPLMEGLTQGELYNLIFNDDGAARAPASTLVSDPAERTAMRAALAKYPSQRANEIAAWLAR